MISNNRADYGSADEWLSALKQDELWLSQLQQLQNSTPEDASTLRYKANEKIGKGETYGFWDSYNHQVEPVVREVWEIAELSLPKLKIQAVGMLSIEWLEQHTEIGGQISKKIKITSSKQKPKTIMSKAKAEKRPTNKPMTLKYYTHGNNGLLMKQRRRVNIVFRKFCEWGWIDDRTTADDFDALFEGVPRHCNITWKSNTTILTILLQKLLKQHYIAKQTRQSPSSMVKEQFGLTPNFDQSRLVDDNTFGINATTFLLDIRNPLPLRKGGGDDENDTADVALQAVMSGQLRSTKGI